MSLFFFRKLTAATVLKLCKEQHFLAEKPGDEIEWRSVTSRYHGSQISGSQQFFLPETAVCIVETMEDHAIMHGKVVHFIPYMHVRFFLSNLQDRALLRSKSFISMATTCPLYRARSCITFILRADFDATVRLREVIALASQENKKQNKTKQAKLLQWTTLWRFRLQVFSLCTDVPSFLRKKSEEETSSPLPIFFRGRKGRLYTG